MMRHLLQTNNNGSKNGSVPIFLLEAIDLYNLLVVNVWL